MADPKEKLQEVELSKSSKQLLKNTESTTASIYQDLEDVGDQVDWTKVTVEQLAKEFRKLRHEQEQFRLEHRKFIADEVQKQIKPLVEQLTLLTTKNPRFVYIKFKFRIPFLRKLFRIILFPFTLPFVIIKKTWLWIRR